MEKQAHPDVALAREEAFRDAGSVQPRPRDVHGGHEEEPAHLPHRGSLDKALGDGEVHRGYDATQPQPHEHTCRNGHTTQAEHKAV